MRQTPRNRKIQKHLRSTRALRPSLIDRLEPRQLLATIGDANWSGGGNETRQTAQGPTTILPRIQDTYRVEGTVGGSDANDWFALNLSSAGTVAISQSTWLAGSTPGFELYNASGGFVVAKQAGTTTATLAAGVNYLRLIGASASSYYSFEMALTPTSTPPPPSPTDLGGVPSARLARLGKGISISRWFWTPQNTTAFSKSGQVDFLANQEIASLYKLGFRNIRLLVGVESMMRFVGNAQGDYTSAFRVQQNGGAISNWYTSQLGTTAAQTAELNTKWDRIKAAVNRITAAANAAKTNASDADMIVTLVPYEVAHSLEFGPWGGDARPEFQDARVANFATLWQAFATRLISGTGALTPEQVAFEPLNEPEFLGQNDRWKTLQRKVFSAIRAADPQARYTIVASAPAKLVVGDIRGLTGFDIDSADKGNIVYNAKFYEPGAFASQGSKNLRTSSPSFVGWMHSLPYPFNQTISQSIIPNYQYNVPYDASVPGYSTFLAFYNKYPWFYQGTPRSPQQVANDVFSYAYGIDASEPIPGYTPGSGYNSAYVRGRATQLANWSTTESVPVLISEIGVNAGYAPFSNAASYGDGVNNDARYQYFADAKAALSAAGIGFILWGYDDTNAFGIAKASDIVGNTEASRAVPLTTLANTGRMITNTDGTPNFARLDRDILAAFGFATTFSVTNIAVAVVETMNPIPIEFTATSSTLRRPVRSGILFDEVAIV